MSNKYFESGQIEGAANPESDGRQVRPLILVPAEHSDHQKKKAGLAKGSGSLFPPKFKKNLLLIVCAGFLVLALVVARVVIGFGSEEVADFVLGILSWVRNPGLGSKSGLTSFFGLLLSAGGFGLAAYFLNGIARK